MGLWNSRSALSWLTYEGTACSLSRLDEQLGGNSWVETAGWKQLGGSQRIEDKAFTCVMRVRAKVVSLQGSRLQYGARQQ